MHVRANYNLKYEFDYHYGAVEVDGTDGEFKVTYTKNFGGEEITTLTTVNWSNLKNCSPHVTYSGCDDQVTFGAVAEALSDVSPSIRNELANLGHTFGDDRKWDQPLYESCRSCQY